MLHPHHEIIIEYLEGKVIEVYVSDEDRWEELGTVSSSLFMPLFHRDILYRVKPKSVTKVSVLKISYGEEDNEHYIWSTSQMPNLRLYWLDNKLINAEVIV